MKLKNIFKRNKPSPKSYRAIGENGVSVKLNTANPMKLSDLLGREEALCVSTVFRCTTLISSSIGNLELEAFKRDSKGFGKKVVNKPINQLLEYPNKIDTLATLLQKVVIQVIKSGVGVIEIFRDPRTYEPIELRVAEKVSIELSKEDYDYVYTITDDYGIRTRSSDDVIHISGVMPNKYGVGKSIFSYANDTLKLGTLATKYLEHYFGNRLFARGIISLPGEVSPETLEYIQGVIDENSGVSNGDDVILLTGDAKYSPMTGAGPGDTGALDMRSVIISEVARFFGIGLEKLNLREKSQSINQSEDVQFFNDCLKIYVTQLEREFSKKVNFIDTKEYFRFNTKYYTSIGRDQAESYSKLIHYGMLTPNEARQELNLPPINGGDKSYMNYIPLESTGDYFNKNNNNPKSNTDEGKKSNTIESED